MSDTIRIFKNSSMFDNTIMVSKLDLEANKTESYDNYVVLYNDDTIVGYNIFDKDLSEKFEEGHNYPNEENLKLVNEFLDESFTYNKDKYLLVGEVVDFEAVKNSKNLNMCKVLIKDKEYAIVCGAQNLKKGMKSIVALDNAILPDGTLIKAGNVLNNHSDGMLCSKRELGLRQNADEKGIIELDDNEEVSTSFFDIDWRKYNV